MAYGIHGKLRRQCYVMNVTTMFASPPLLVIASRADAEYAAFSAPTLIFFFFFFFLLRSIFALFFAATPFAAELMARHAYSQLMIL